MPADPMPISPLAPEGGFPTLPEIAGLRFAATAAGVKYRGRDDVMLALAGPNSVIAGVFTKSATRAAPVLDCQTKLSDAVGPVAILVNSGNANAFTGSAGDASVARISQAVAETIDIPASRVFTASTGVIGEVLPDDKIRAKIKTLAENLRPDAAEAAARATMTTDTFPKGATRTAHIQGRKVQLIGFAKGSGMIAPDMATMLVHIFTDAKIEQPALQALVSKLSDQTFNAITVDSDTSTSDSLLMVATGEGAEVAQDDPAFEQALHALMLDLAHQVVRDGEGASKFVEIKVRSARSDEDAKRVALAIANSPLVKTALAGEDPNWGRIIMAIGKSGAEANRDRIAIFFGDILVAEKGWVAESYTEEAGADYMKGSELKIGVDLGLAEGSATVWTCDLTHQYITINADYRS